MQRKRNTTIAAAASFVVHLAVLYGIGAGLHMPREHAAELNTEPIRIRLTPPPEPDPVRTRQLVETLTPANEPVEVSDLIAETNSQASDVAARESETLGPTSVEESDFDHLAVPTPPEEPAAPTPPPAPPSPESVATEAVPESEPAPAPEPAPQPAPPTRMAKLEPAPRALPEPKPETVAAAARPPQPEAPQRPRTPKLPEGRTTGRQRGGVDAVGFVGFEAMQDEIAPYLKEIQAAVELRWREMLLTRYSGVSPTIADIDCEIAADGTIVHVTPVGTPKDPVYAALCRNAIQKAGPFKPFPFTVPPEYANRNLEIRWTFNFLMRP